MAEQLPQSVDDFLSHLAVEKGRAANTLAAYRRDLRIYLAWLAPTPLHAVTGADVLAFTHFLRDSDRAPATVNRVMATVRGLHRFLMVEELSAVDPTADIESIRLPRGLPKALSEDDVTALIDAVAGFDPVARRDRAMLELLYGTGLRVSELVSISLDEIDLQAALMRVTGKGDKQRLVPIGRLAGEALDGWLSPEGRGALCPTKWATRDAESAVFLNQRGGRLSRQGAWGVVRHYGLLTGIADRLSPHVLRHSCATHMLDHGADIRTVQELLGHASVTTTQLYTKVSTDLMQREYKRAHPRAVGRPGGHA